MKVLIADGSAMVTDRVQSMMRDITNVELLEPADCARDTLDAIRRHDPEVLIVDVCMPGAKEMELLQTVRQEKPNLILIILTNLDYPEYRKPLETLGADLCLDKSHEFILLFQIVNELARISFESDGPAAKTSLRKQVAPARLRVGLQCGLSKVASPSVPRFTTGFWG